MPPGHAEEDGMVVWRSVLVRLQVLALHGPAQPFPPGVVELMAAIMPLFGVADKESWPNSCNASWYRGGGESVEWHSDDELLFQGKDQPIRSISLSLVQKRTFQIQGTWHHAPVVSQVLMDGDLRTMDGWVQKHYMHRVPEEPEEDGDRINFTWKWVRGHQDGCARVAKAQPGSAAQASPRS